MPADAPALRPPSPSVLFQSEAKSALRSPESRNRRPASEEPWWLQSRETGEDASSATSSMDGFLMASSTFSYDEMDGEGGYHEASGQDASMNNLVDGNSLSASRTQEGVSYNNKATYEVRWACT